MVEEYQKRHYGGIVSVIEEIMEEEARP